MKFLKSILPVITAGLFAAGISIMFNSDVVRATLYHWSQTAASNSNADGTINWAEGQSPSSVNDSARAMMAATAKFRDDVSGKLVLGGTSTAYTVTSNQVFSSLSTMDGAELAFRIPAATTSGATPTLNVDALGAKALNQASGVAVPTGALVAGAIYRATYVNASNEWIVNGITGAVPSGTAMLSVSSACPTGWTKSVANNDKALRIVSGTPSTGGSVAFSTLFGRTGTDAVTLAAGNIPALGAGTLALSSGTVTVSAHQHSFTYANQTVAAGGGQSVVTAIDQSSFANTVNVSSVAPAASVGTGIGGSVGAASPSTFTPAIDMRVRYVDVIACSKD